MALPLLVSMRIPYFECKPGTDDALCPVPAHHRHTCNRRQHGWEKIATTAGTLSTTNGVFVFLLIVVVLLIGALGFFPALALGPLAEFFGSIA